MIPNFSQSGEANPDKGSFKKIIKTAGMEPKIQLMVMCAMADGDHSAGLDQLFLREIWIEAQKEAVIGKKHGRGKSKKKK